MSPALWAVPLLATLILLFYLALSMGYIAPFILTLYQWKVGAIVIQLALVAVLVTSHALDRRSAPDEDEGEAEEVKAEYIDVKQQPAPKAKAKQGVTVTAKPAPAAPAAPAPAVPLEPEEGAGKPQIIEYPEKTSGGIYADTHIPVGGGRYLKLRTLVARSCILCDEQDRCFNIVRHNVSAEGFKSNIDCREGLKIEGSRV
jgi:hypothetical protein